MSCPASDGTAQVIGVAYTYETSQAMRRELTGRHAGHSSWTDSFSYFLKCRLDEAVPDRGQLRLRPGEPAPHWPEAELAALLGPGHRIVAYALANDLTAFTAETGPSSPEADNTYLGKCWPGSCGLGPRFVPAGELGAVDDLPVGLRVEDAGGRLLYEGEYRTSSRTRPFSELPDLIVRRRRRLGAAAVRSKRIVLDDDGRLPAGTVILLGTGLIVPGDAYCRAGQRVSITCPGLGALTNVVSAA